MTPGHQAKSQPAKFRRQAEKRVAKHVRTAASQSGSDTRRLMHKLEVHQVELELQNEELLQARAELEASYNELYDFAPVGYFTLGRNGDIEKTNLTGAAMLGQPRARLHGQRFASFVAPESLPYFDCLINCLLGLAMVEYDKESCMVTLMKGGTTPIFAYIEATVVGPDSRIRAVVMDITSAEQARNALRDSEERLRLALDASGMGVWKWECDTRDFYWSPECITIFGVDCLCPTLDTLTTLLHPHDTERAAAVLGRALADGKEQSVEFRIIRPNGEVVWIFARGQVQCDKAGKPLRLIGIAQDITGRKRAEQEANVYPA